MCNSLCHGVDYCFAVFDMCNGSYHHGLCVMVHVTDKFAICGMCSGLCHGELSK